MKFDTPAGQNPIDQLKIVGRPHDRIDGKYKTTGTALYAYERNDAVANHAYGYIVGSAIAKGRINAIDLAEAKAAPGVIAIVTAADAGKLSINVAARGSAPTDNGGFVAFRDASSAGSANITTNDGATVEFRDKSSAGNAVIDNRGGLTNFLFDASAGQAQITNHAKGQINLMNDASAGQARVVNESGGLIDFYFSCTDIRAYDLAIMHGAWCFSVDGADFHADVAAGLMAGYAHAHGFTPAEYAAFPVLARGAAMRFLLTRAYDWINTPATALVTRKDPLAYLRRLDTYTKLDAATLFGPAG